MGGHGGCTTQIGRHARKVFAKLRPVSRLGVLSSRMKQAFEGLNVRVRASRPVRQEDGAQRIDQPTVERDRVSDIRTNAGRTGQLPVVGTDEGALGHGGIIPETIANNHQNPHT